MMENTLDMAQTCCGTPCYLSPELCQDMPYSSKADVWVCHTVVLYAQTYKSLIGQAARYIYSAISLIVEDSLCCYIPLVISEGEWIVLTPDTPCYLLLFWCFFLRLWGVCCLRCVLCVTPLMPVTLWVCSTKLLKWNMGLVVCSSNLMYVWYLSRYIALTFIPFFSNECVLICSFY